MTDSEDAELLQVFLEEAREHLDGIEGDLLQLESKQELDPEVVNKIFRAVHSVKGGAGFFGLVEIKTLSHAMENVLGAMQKGRLRPTSPIIGVLLKAADALVHMIAAPEVNSGTDTSGLVLELDTIGAESKNTTPGKTTVAVVVADTVNVDTVKAQSAERTSEPERNQPPREPSANRALSPSETSVRVHIGILDRLMSLAGELVLTRNQLLQSHENDNSSHSEATQRIDHITTELQDAIMSTRMQSIGIVFQKFRRVVRDLANSLGKEVDLIIEGEDVELDRTIVEAIGDPLTHLVRNSLDHGIEKPAVREAQNKPRRGILRLSALHKAGQVIIEIADDGAGIDPTKVRAKALEKGLCTREQLAGMSESAIVKLIFRPGFSTATEVTEVSGRGVGMDVVHSNLSKLGGVVDVQSNVGGGTLMRIKLPLTLAIIPCLLVAEETESFAIPQANLIELLRIPAKEVKSRVKSFGNVQVLSLRGDLIPLIRLRDALGIQQRTFDTEDIGRLEDRRHTAFDRRQQSLKNDDERRDTSDRRLSHRSAINIAVVAAGDFRYGIMVESLLDSLEIVVKPLGRHLQRCNSYAGSTILGDGRLALILDVVSIGHRLQYADSNEAVASAKLASQKVADSSDQMTLMLVESSGEELLAIPLGLIERIEQVNRRHIQVVGGKRTLTYRGRSLPLLGVDEVVNVGACRTKDNLYAVVYRSYEREVGLLVSELVDIVDSTTDFDSVTHQQSGVFGSLLVEGKIALLLDIHGIARERLGISATAPSVSTQRTFTVLVVEDSRFFRERIAEFNRDAGYKVLTAEDGLEGLETLQKHAGEVDLVITDIEMPRLDGFEFTTRLRADARFQKLPVVAVTSLMGEEAEQRGRQAGITEYLIKLDRERIMDRVKHYLSSRDSEAQWSAA